MREMLFAFTILLTLNSCSTFKSGLTIPANQTFLLGEFNNKNYSAELVNKSNLTVIVKAVVKKTGEVTQSFGLAPKGRTKVYISKDEIVYFFREIIEGFTFISCKNIRSQIIINILQPFILSKT